MSESKQLKPNSGQFKPGVSGNPSGRPKGLERRAKEILGEEYVDPQTEDRMTRLDALVRKMISIALSESHKGSDRIAAAKLVFERAYGAARQSFEVKGDFDVAVGVNFAPLTLEQLRTIATLDNVIDADATELPSVPALPSNVRHG